MVAVKMTQVHVFTVLLVLLPSALCNPCDTIPNPCPKYKKCLKYGGSYKCVCMKGWTGAKCEKQGCTGGDPHYTTFDGKRYDFMGRCEYIYAKDCSKDHSFEVLQQNEVCNTAKTVSCTKTIRVFFQQFEVILERSGVVYVNGDRASLPWRYSGVTITKNGAGAFLDVPELLFSVKWDGNMGICVNINQHYKGKMCGLMGNADGIPNNDFQLPDKTPAKNVAEFGNSWRKNPRCVNGIVPANPCKKLSPAKYKEVKEKCGKMKANPFQQCNDKITPDVQYIPDCEYDLCGMKGDPSAAWCQSLETYDNACKAKGVNIHWVGQAGFKECGNPCANLPCFNGAKCKNINRREFKCTCPDGFSGPTCEDVVCKRGYLSRGKFCYKKMSKKPWKDAECPTGEQFVSPENEDEDNFIYTKFVVPWKQPFWINARVCGVNKLCRKDMSVVYYHNFLGRFPRSGCVEMAFGYNGKWSSVGNCGKESFYICEHEIF